MHAQQEGDSLEVAVAVVAGAAQALAHPCASSTSHLQPPSQTAPPTATTTVASLIAHPPPLAPASPCPLQLGALVPLLLRTMRAPRLATARAAILTFQDLFAAEGLGDAMCTSGAIADDSGPTSSAILALMQKATGEEGTLRLHVG